MHECQLGQLQMGYPTQSKPQKRVNCYTTAEYIADPITYYAG